MATLKCGLEVTQGH